VAKGASSKTVLVLDDEPEYLDWVVDYLESHGLAVQFASTLANAIDMVSRREYCLFLVDMNVPDGGATTPEMLQRTPLIAQFPGLALAQVCRNAGYGRHSVIAYTVHDHPGAEAELEKLWCRYVLKGRPEVLKSVIDKSLPGSRK
jgi:CheY-like chemotaxis protein